MKKILLPVIFQFVVIFGLKAQTATVDLYSTRQLIKGSILKQGGKFTYTIYDVTGSIVGSGSGINELIVGENLIPGMYFISIEHEASEYVQKIVKQ